MTFLEKQRTNDLLEEQNKTLKHILKYLTTKRLNMKKFDDYLQYHTKRYQDLQQHINRKNAEFSEIGKFERTIYEMLSEIQGSYPNFVYKVEGTTEDSYKHLFIPVSITILDANRRNPKKYDLNFTVFNNLRQNDNMKMELISEESQNSEIFKEFYPDYDKEILHDFITTMFQNLLEQDLKTKYPDFT